MNQLGFAINYASNGYEKDIVCNEGKWTENVDDIRNYLKYFDGLRGTDKIITFIFFDESGCYLTLLRPVSGRGNDFRAGWIYIPNAIEISTSEIMEAYEHAKVWLLKSIRDTRSDIERFFSKGFAEKQCFLKNIPSSGEKFGYRKLGTCSSMEKLFSSGIYQEYYNGHKAIFLLDDNSVTISNEYTARFTDFTNEKMEQYCILMPPTEDKIRPLGPEAQIVDGTGRIFDSPMRVKLGEHVQLCARRKGFEDIRIPMIDVSNSVTEFPLCHSIVWEKRIDATMFHIIDHEKKKITDATIIVDGTDITCGSAMLSEAGAKKVSVIIKAHGYKDESETINVLDRTEPIEIRMHRKEKEREFKVLMSNSKYARMTLSSVHLNDDVPLIGYTTDKKNKNCLVPNDWYLWKQRFIGIGISIVGVILIVGIIAFDSWLDNHEFRWGVPPWRETSASAQNLEYTQDPISGDQKSAVALYLDNTTTWNRDSLENYEETKGLFDALNGFDFPRVKEYEGKLSNSDNFMRIINTINDIKGKDLNPKVGKEAHRGNYNSVSDKRIQIGNYIKRISSYHAPTYEQSVPETNTGSAIKSGEAKNGSQRSIKPKPDTSNKKEPAKQNKRNSEN